MPYCSAEKPIEDEGMEGEVDFCTGRQEKTEKNSDKSPCVKGEVVNLDVFACLLRTLGICVRGGGGGG